MSNEPLISVIVPIYKVEAYLDKCISSIVNQTYTKLEIILIDDGSPDNCPLMCDTWAEKDHRIIVIHKENGGLSAARNTGIEEASGRWLLFIDADDAIPADYVQLLAAQAANCDRLVVGGNMRFIDIVPQYSNSPIVKACGKDLASVRGGLYCWGALYSREIVSELGLQFDISLRNVEDVVWNGIYLRYVSNVVYVDVPYFYRMNPTSITSRCSDYKWQIASWIAARRSIMNWFADKSLSTSQRKEVVGMFRHCQNNIYAECVAGNISYGDLQAMEREQSARFNKGFISAPERFVMNHLPRLYYYIYTSALRAKNILSTN